VNDLKTIDLCLEVFWWAKFRKHKAAIKLHTLFDVRCQIPCFIHITDGLSHDVNVLDILEFEAEAFYVMDRGYLDWARLYIPHPSSQCLFRNSGQRQHGFCSSLLTPGRQVLWIEV
jgi:hypothetical protein